MDATAGRSGSRAHRTLPFFRFHRGFRGQYPVDGTPACRGGGTDLPWRTATPIHCAYLHTHTPYRDMDNRHHLLGDTLSVLRLYPPHALGCRLRLRAGMVGQSVAADADALHQQCPCGHPLFHSAQGRLGHKQYGRLRHGRHMVGRRVEPHIGSGRDLFAAAFHYDEQRLLANVGRQLNVAQLQAAHPAWDIFFLQRIKHFAYHLVLLLGVVFRGHTCQGI